MPTNTRPPQTQPQDDDRPKGISRRRMILTFVLAGSAALGALYLNACTGDEDPATPSPTPTATSDGVVPTATPFPTGTAAPSTPSATETPATGSPTATATPGAGESTEATPEDAVGVLDAYFSAIGLRDFETAYNLWRNNGEASGQTYEEFVDGFAATASISWDIGDPGRIDPGAGQRYIEIPVRIIARTSAGEDQHFEGSYVLHHTANIDGATPEQLLWRLHSAEITAVD